MSAAASVAASAKLQLPNAQGRAGLQRLQPGAEAAAAANCTDIRGFPGEDNANTWGGRFYDNGHYIGHDEPDTTFLSNAPGPATT